MGKKKTHKASRSGAAASDKKKKKRPVKTAENALVSFFHISALINSSLDTDTVLENVLQTATELVQAEASSILLVQEDSEEIVFKTTLGVKAQKVKKFKLKLGEGIAGWVALSGEPILAPDVQKEPRFAEHIAKTIQFKTRNILCVAMKTKNRIIGSLEVINKIGGQGACFDEEDMKLLTAMAGQAAIAIENARLYNEAITDELTGLYSYRYFQTHFYREIKRAERMKQPLSILMIDLDDFKKFNDTYGHAMGNRVLRAVADSIKSRIRETDVAARFGGEELVIVLQEIDKEAAMNIAERVRRDVELLEIHDQTHGRLGITCSIGVATYPEDTTDREELFFHADQGMYEAKQRGKNQVRSLS